MVPSSHFSLRKWFPFYGYGFLLYIPFILPIFSFPGSASAYASNGKIESITLTITITRINNSSEDTLTGELDVTTNVPERSTYIILPFATSSPKTLKNEFNGKFTEQQCDNDNNYYSLIKIPSNASAQGNKSRSAILRFNIIPPTQLESYINQLNTIFFQLNYSYDPTTLADVCKINGGQMISPKQVVVQLSTNEYSPFPLQPLSPVGSSGVVNYNSMYQSNCSYRFTIYHNSYQFSNEIDFFNKQRLQICYVFTPKNPLPGNLSLSELASIVLAIIGIFIPFSIFIPFLGVRTRLVMHASFIAILIIINIYHIIYGFNHNDISSIGNKVSFVVAVIIVLYLFIFWAFVNLRGQGLILGPTIPESSKRFLKKADREWIITIVTTIIGNMEIEEMKNLLRDILSDESIERINFHEGSRNIAVQMVERLEQRGALNSGDHALGRFLVDLIETDKVGTEEAVRLQAILSENTLLKDSRQITAPRSRLQLSGY